MLELQHGFYHLDSVVEFALFWRTGATNRFCTLQMKIILAPELFIFSQGA
jgi:hypothetical protein